MEINNVFIVGAGLMGSGIAQVCAQAGMRVYIHDIHMGAIEKCLKDVEWSVSKLIEKNKLYEDMNTILDRIHYAEDFSKAAEADLAIEAVIEKSDLKQEVFRKLDSACGPEAILASNTSAIPITELATVTGRSERVLGLHFFSPVPMMNAVEVIKGMDTSEDTIQKGITFVKKLGKEPVRVERDLPGFLLNRINLVGYVEAIQLLEQGIGTVEDIDRGVRLAFGRRMGPFEVGDMVGLEVSLGALMAIYEESRDMRYYPPQLLRRKVKSGQLGRKKGKGWYLYDDAGNCLGPA